MVTDLRGAVVLVTGSSSGIGEGVARRFAREGAVVVVNSSSSVEAGTALAAELDGAVYVQADIAVDADARRLVAETVERLGRLDVVVNNAGTTRVIPHHDLEAVTDEVWNDILTVNVLGTWHVTRAAVPALRSSGGGSIVNVTSIAGLRPIGSSIPYAASKAALNHVTVLLARTLGPEIRVNAVAPGLIDTPWTADWDEIRDHVRTTSPARRSGTPDDIAEACVFLAHADYVTGQVVVVDGGLTLV